MKSLEELAEGIPKHNLIIIDQKVTLIFGTTTGANDMLDSYNKLGYEGQERLYGIRLLVEYLRMSKR
jgi:hypothetical protein